MVIPTAQGAITTVQLGAHLLAAPSRRYAQQNLRERQQLCCEIAETASSDDVPRRVTGLDSGLGINREAPSSSAATTPACSDLTTNRHIAHFAPPTAGTAQCPH